MKFNLKRILNKNVFLLISVLIIGMILAVLLVRINTSNLTTTPLSQNNINYSVRKPAVSGSFYPAEKETLNNKISSLMDNSEIFLSIGKVRILISPHAGIDYSGKVASSAFKQIEGKKYKTVIILGSSHKVSFNSINIDDNNYWETPLGKVELDNAYINKILVPGYIVLDKETHLSEHSLEMQLIYLQKAISDFKIVPILIGQVNKETLYLLAQKIAQNFNDETLLVISTDLSHYPSFNLASTVDNKVIESILTGESEEFEKTVSEVENRGYPDLVTAVCAYKAVVVGLRVGKLIGVNDYKEILYENSGDITGESNKVVGYVSIEGVSDEVNYINPQLNSEGEQEALHIARETLENFFNSDRILTMNIKSDYLYEPLGVFVTLKKDNELRGCIGNFEPNIPLYKVIQNTAISAATKDIRFKPVRREELEDIKIEISVMTPRRKISSWQNIELGKDGVYLEKDSNSGTFLPQVAIEQNWNLDTFLQQLCSQKANLPKDCYNDKDTNLYTFQVQEFSE